MHAVQVRVKRRGDDKKFLARVLAIGTECDLALLTVDDEAFWKGLEPMHLGELPSLQESVAVVGYPVGGDTISVTAGVVSRIEVRPHCCSALPEPQCFLDARFRNFPPKFGASFMGLLTW